MAELQDLSPRRDSEAVSDGVANQKSPHGRTSNPFLLPAHGYPRIAEKMSVIPETAIFRSFLSANIEILLYKQAEIEQLLRQLRTLQGVNSRSEDVRVRESLRNFYFLEQLFRRVEYSDLENQRSSVELGSLRQSEGSASSLTPDDRETARDSDETDRKTSSCNHFVAPIEVRVRDLYETIDRKLGEYNGRFLQIANMCGFDEPTEFDLNYIQRLVSTPARDSNTGRPILPLTGLDRDIWGSLESPADFAPDLIAILRRQRMDPSTTWFIDRIVGKLFSLPWLPKSLQPAQVNGIYAYTDTRISRWTHAIYTVLIFTLIWSTIAVLIIIKDIRLRAFVAAMAMGFLLIGIHIFGTPTRTELLALLISFSAIVSVFLVNQNPIIIPPTN